MNDQITMTLALVNIVLRVTLTFLMGFLVIRFGDRLIWPERAGAGLVGGSSFMTTAVIADLDRYGTPFDGWATLLLTLGVIILSGGMCYRKWRHDVNNTKAVEQSRDHFASKAKP